MKTLTSHASNAGGETVADLAAAHAKLFETQFARGELGISSVRIHLDDSSAVVMVLIGCPVKDAEHVQGALDQAFADLPEEHGASLSWDITTGSRL